MHYTVSEVPSDPSPPVAPCPTTEEPKKVESVLPGKDQLSISVLNCFDAECASVCKWLDGPCLCARDVFHFSLSQSQLSLRRKTVHQTKCLVSLLALSLVRNVCVCGYIYTVQVVYLYL